MNTRTGQQFSRVVDRGGAEVRDLRLEDCEFERCAFSMTADLSRRSRVVDVELAACRSVGSMVGCAIFEGCKADGLRTDGLLQIWGAVFNRCIIQGRVDRLMVSGLLPQVLASTHQQSIAKAAASAYYSAVDWALDISEASFVEADLRGIPTTLVRRDPATQVIVLREAAMRGTWRNVNLVDPLLPHLIQGFLDGGEPSELFVAGKRAQGHRKTIEGLSRLVDLGVAVR